MSTLKFLLIRGAKAAKKFWNGDVVWHIDLADPKGNASTAATIEALNLR